MGEDFHNTSEVEQNDNEVVHAAIMSLLTKRYNMITVDSSVHHQREFERIGSFICKLVSKQVLIPVDVVHVAAASGLYWTHGMSKLIEQDHAVLESKDEGTGLLPFMTFASSNES